VLKVKANDQQEFKVDFNHENRLSGKVNDLDFIIDLIRTKANSYHLIKDHKSYNIEILKADATEKAFTILVNGHKFHLDVKDRYDELLKNLGMDNMSAGVVKEVKAPMPGLVVDIMIEPGIEVAKDDPVIVLEAMKMENVLKSPTEGIIKSIAIEKGQAVEKNQVLIHFE
jgi:biotin carboxyl carrier protein